MSKSLAELTAETSVVSEPRTYTACVGAGRKLVAEVGLLTEELALLPARTSADDEDKQGPPRRVGQGKDPRVTEIQERLAVLLEEMAQYEGVLRIEATKTDGEWRQWVNTHPARNDDQPGHKRDLEVTGGYCSADALLDDLAAYVVAWNDEPMGDGTFDKLGVSAPDKKAIASIVVSMYEAGVSLPKWRSALSATLLAGRGSISPEPSGSPNDDSSDGNLPSDTSTTTLPGL